jgi:ubiquinone biosynthesis protein
VDLRSLSKLGRFRDLITVMLRYGFDDMVERLEVPGMGIVRRFHHADVELTAYQRIRLALEELGPTFVKFGQIMSLRPDLLPPPMILELQKLQDDVAPLDFESIRPVVEEEMGSALEDRFSRFEETPTAAASLSQVHRAVMKDSGLAVAVKVQRPDIQGIIRADLDILEAFARQVHERVEGVQVYDLPNIVRVTRRLLLRELDFTREARNMKVARSFMDAEMGVNVPRVHMDHSTDKLLVMELILGTRLREVDPRTLDHPEALAGNGLRAAIKQILEDGFFHADPHPGNIMLTEGNVLCILDWGMVGRLTTHDRYQLIDLIQTIVERDSRKLVDCLQDMSSNTEEVDRSALERDLLDILDEFHSVPLKRLNLGNILLDIASLLRTHRLRLPSDLVVMMKALVTAEGTARGIYPELNVVAEAEGHVRRLATQRHNPRVAWKELRTTLDRFKSLASGFPNRVTRIMDKMDRGELHIRFEHENLGPLRRTLDNSSNRLTLGIIIGAMIIGSSMIITTGVGPLLFGFPMLGVLGYSVSAVLGLWLVFNILRSRKY